MKLIGTTIVYSIAYFSTALLYTNFKIHIIGFFIAGIIGTCFINYIDKKTSLQG